MLKLLNMLFLSHLIQYSFHKCIKKPFDEIIIKHNSSLPLRQLLHRILCNVIIIDISTASYYLYLSFVFVPCELTLFLFILFFFHTNFPSLLDLTNSSWYKLLYSQFFKENFLRKGLILPVIIFCSVNLGITSNPFTESNLPFWVF